MDTNNVTRPKTYEITSSTLAAAFLATIIFFSLVLNLFVCIAVTCCRKLRLASSVYVVNLCVADLLITVFSMSLWLWLHIDAQQFSANFAKHRNWVSTWITVDIFCGTLSILSLAAISVDKYIAITRPLRYKADMTKKRNAIVIVLLWVYSIITSSIYWARSPLGPLEWQIMLHVLVVICFVIPLIVILCAYGKIYFIAKSHAQMVNSQAGRKKAKEIKAAKTIAIVIGTFCVCWAPFFIINILYSYNVNPGQFALHGSKWLTYLNAFLNPLIYTLLDRRFRTVFLEKTSCCLSPNTEMFGPVKDSSSDPMCAGMSSVTRHKESQTDTTSATQC